MRYDDLPIILRGSPGAMGRHRVSIEPWAVFGTITAGGMLLVGIGWLRRLIAQMGPE